MNGAHQGQGHRKLLMNMICCDLCFALHTFAMWPSLPQQKELFICKVICQEIQCKSFRLVNPFFLSNIEFFDFSVNCNFCVPKASQFNVFGSVVELSSWPNDLYLARTSIVNLMAQSAVFYLCISTGGLIHNNFRLKSIHHLVSFNQLLVHSNTNTT